MGCCRFTMVKRDGLVNSPHLIFVVRILQSPPRSHSSLGQGQTLLTEVRTKIQSPTVGEDQARRRMYF